MTAKEDPDDEAANRAERLHELIDRMERSGPDTTKPESPRDFINRRMTELEQENASSTPPDDDEKSSR